MRPLCLPAAGFLAASMLWAAAAPESSCLRLASAIAGPDEPAALEQLQSGRWRILGEPQSAEARGRLGMIAHAYESFSAALACYDEALALAPEALRWRYYRARVLARMGRDDEALTELRWIVERQPEHTQAQLLRAELFLRAGELDRAIAAAQTVLRQDPRSARALFLVGQARAARGDHVQAAESFEKALESKPYYAQARYALALAYRRTGRGKDAAQQLAIHQRLGQAPPPRDDDPLMDEVEALNHSARAEVAAGSIAARAGELDKAIEHFEKALEMNPRLAAARSNLILLYGRTRRLNQAEHHYQQAIAVSPNGAEAHANWGRALLQEGRVPEAAAALEMAVAAAPHSVQARLQLGQIYERLERPDDALEQYLQAVEGDPLDRDAQRLLGGALVAAGRIEAGLDALEKAVDVQDGRAAEYMEGLSRAHEEDGRFELALGYARRAMRHGPGDELENRLLAAIERLEAKLESAP